MGKSYKNNDRYRPKKQGQVFTKDNPWKKNKKHKHKFLDENGQPLNLDIPEE